MSAELAFRDADPSEDDELARIIYNAFLPVWNHNWFQCLTAPISSIPRSSQHEPPLNPLQSRRLAFYKAWINLNRAHKGDVIIAYTPSSSIPAREPEQKQQEQDQDNQTPSSSTTIAAVVLLLPPHARPSWSQPLLAWRTGFLPGLISTYGLRGMWRACYTFENTIERVITRGLKERNIEGGKQERLLFCQCCVRNPEWKGPKGPGRRLFDWGIRRFWRDVARVPCWLDVSTAEGRRAYEEIGFELIEEWSVDAGTDGEGIQLKEGVTEDERREAREATKLRVMVRMPEEE